MSIAKTAIGLNCPSPNKTERFLVPRQGAGQVKISGMPILEIIFALAAAGLVLIGVFAFGYRQAEKQRQDLFSTGELDNLSNLMESLTRFASFAKKADAFYLDGIVKIWKTRLQTVCQEVIVDIQHGETIYPTLSKQNLDWVDHAWICLQDQNPLWAEDDEILTRSLQGKHTSPLLLTIQDGATTRLVAFFLPRLQEEKRRPLSGYFNELNKIVADIRKRTISSAYYEHLAQDLQDSSTRMKRLFANVEHNTANILSGMMAGLGYVHAQRENGGMNPEKVVEVLDRYVLPSYTVSREMITQMNASINAIIEEHNKHNAADFPMGVLFERYFGTWLSDQSKRIAGDVEVAWDIPEDLIIRTSDLVFFQVVWNVLKNAVKYTRQGSIKITTFHGTDGRIYLRVKDTGLGIPQAYQNNIGTYGFRGDQEGQVEGEGIGLWGAYQMIETVGGNIYFNSTQGVGTEFNIGFLKGAQ
jgi:signal transduction histidine kinase